MMGRALGAGILWQKMTIREGEADKKLESIRKKMTACIQKSKKQILKIIMRHWKFQGYILTRENNN